MTNTNETQPFPPNPSPGSDREMNHEARLWGMFCHLAGFAAFLPILPVFGGILGPLIVWLIKKDQYPFVDEQGKEAVNFQITILIYTAIAAVLLLVCIGILLLPAVIITDIVLIVMASIKANDGFHYRYPYPLIIRFIK
jgi:uncharacterized Tic20 family protein